MTTREWVGVQAGARIGRDTWAAPEKIAALAALPHLRFPGYGQPVGQHLPVAAGSWRSLLFDQFARGSIPFARGEEK